MLFTILAKGCPEEALPAGSAILAFMQNLGMLVGTTLIGTVVSNLGWPPVRTSCLLYNIRYITYVI